MSDDPLAARLSRFTPDASGLDHDALLFAAGRASARPPRRWAVLAGALCVTQLITLAMLLVPRAASVSVPPAPAPGTTATRPVPAEPAPAADHNLPNLVVLRDAALAADGDLPALRPVDSLAPPGPPLRAFAAPGQMH